MTSQELLEVVDQRISDPVVLGRLACNLHHSDVVEQRHSDGRTFDIAWEHSGDFWRCTIFASEDRAHRLAQVDIHENGTVRVDAFESCRVTISPEEGLLCLTRYRQPA